jgi:hypothetical protein
VTSQPSWRSRTSCAAARPTLVCSCIGGQNSRPMLRARLCQDADVCRIGARARNESVRRSPKVSPPGSSRHTSRHAPRRDAPGCRPGVLSLRVVSMISERRDAEIR